MSAFEPNSENAMFAQILERLDGVRSDFREHRAETEKRLKEIESEQQFNRGKTAAIALGVSGMVAGAIEVAKSYFTSGHK